MSIFSVNWRTIFKYALPPVVVQDQVLDFGESLLTTIKTESDTLNAKDISLQNTKKYSGIRIVMQASLNEIFGETMFQVETETNPVRFIYFMSEDEYEARYLRSSGEDSDRKFWLYKESEIPALSSIIIRVPTGLFLTGLDQVKDQANKLKIAGKSIRYVSL